MATQIFSFVPAASMEELSAALKALSYVQSVESDQMTGMASDGAKLKVTVQYEAGRKGQEAARENELLRVVQEQTGKGFSAMDSAQEFNYSRVG